MIKNKNSCIAIVRHFCSNYEYENSNIEWMKGIPKSWNLVPLKFVAKFIGGGTPSKANSEYWIGKIPWVSPKDMKSEVLVDSEDHITKEAVENSSTSLILSEAVLLVVRSGILRHSIPVAINARPVTLNQDMKAIIPLQSLEAAYLKYFISGHQNALLFDWRKEGATVESIEHELLANTRILIPSIVEQQAIVAFLEWETAKIDALIAKKKQLIELLQEKRAALINHAVTKGLDPSVPMKDSGVEWLGEMPEHWGIIPLKYKARCRSGEMIATEEILPKPEEGASMPVFGGNGLMGYSNRINIKNTALIIGRVGALCGNVHLIRIPAWITDNALIVQLSSLTFDYGYLSAVLKCRNLNELASKTAQPLITGSQVHDLRIPCPPLNEQRSIADFIDFEASKIDEIISKILNVIEKLKEYRTALISAAVTGKIDVRNEAGVVA